MVIRFLGKKLSSFQIIIFGFLGLILIGTALLMLPFAVKEGSGASLEDALFTSTSAVCVTGLVVRDTASYWSGFGQAVILILIQIGGLGIVSVAAFIAMLSGRKITLLQRSMLQDSISAHQIGGIVKMTGFVFKIALVAELSGTLIMLPVFCGRYGLSGIWMSVFHSVSAFCNAGFDIMGDKTGPFSSLTSFASNPGIVIPICLLIIIGGIGFLTWEDIATNKLHIRSYRMQSKVVLATTGALIIVPMLLLLLFEYTSGAVKGRVFLSLFQAITPRTAGFNTVSFSYLSGAGRMLLVVLMLIGGSPGCIDADRRIPWIDCRRHEDNNNCRSFFRCLLRISEEKKCAAVRKKNRRRYNQKCNNALIDVSASADNRGCRDQLGRRAPDRGLHF